MITIVGAGKFGQCLSKILGTKPHHIVDVEKDGSYSEETKRKISEAAHLFICVPSAFLAQCAQMIKPLIKPGVKILSCTKGLFENVETPTQVLSKTLKNPLATLNGPNLSTEIMEGKPTITTVAGQFSEEWKEMLDCEVFRVFIEKDPVGAEYGAAVKNVVALGAGILDGYYESRNAVGSFVAICVDELEALYRKKFIREIPRLGFIADMIATCISENSRNHEYGHKVGVALRENKTIPEPQGTVEGLRTLAILASYDNKMKTICAVQNVLHGKASVDRLLQSYL